MAYLNDKEYEEFKKISDAQGITYDSELEMKQSADKLVGFFDLLITMDQEERGRRNRLKSEPKGFSMPGNGRNCSLCMQGVYEEGWYDKWGFKCMNCQNAVNKRIVPGSLCGDYHHEKCITDTGLAFKSGLHIQTIRKLIRNGQIKVRQIPNGPSLILRKDNPYLLNLISKVRQAKLKQ